MALLAKQYGTEFQVDPVIFHEQNPQGWAVPDG